MGSQNGWKGPLEIKVTKPLAQAEPHRAGCSAPCSDEDENLRYGWREGNPFPASKSILSTHL